VSTAQIDSHLAQKLADDSTPGLDLVGFMRRRKSFVILFGLLGTGVGYMMLNREVPSTAPRPWCRSSTASQTRVCET
jgi:hypothetical protein